MIGTRIVPVLLAVGLAVSSAPAAIGLHAGSSESQVSATFTWSVPARYGADGMIGVALPVTESNATMRILNPEGTYGGVAPAGWPADFNACGSQGAVRYVWNVNGVATADTTSCGPTRLYFPREGLYRVELQVFQSLRAQATTAQNVNIQDWLIIGMGDSYGSGEGVPNEPANPEDFSLLEPARLALEAAEQNYAAARAIVTAAEANLSAAHDELKTAMANYDGLVAAFAAFNAAVHEHDAAQRAYSLAKEAVIEANQAVAAAAARVAIECAIPFNRAKCTAARNRLAAARAEQAAAIAARTAAEARVKDAQEALAIAIATVPAEGFEHAIAVTQARIHVLMAQIGVLQAEVAAAIQFAEAQAEVRRAAATAFEQQAEGLAGWQDSRTLDNHGNPVRYSQCHQSKFSGQAQAALRIEQDDPKTSVTFIHLACTGAKIFAPAGDPDRGGILARYRGVTPRPDGIGDKEPQLTVAARMSAGREVDALVTSIGGNDVGFADIIKGCMVLEPCEQTTRTVISDSMIEDVCFDYDTQLSYLGLSPLAICRQFLTSARNEMAGVSLAAMLDAKLAALPADYLSLHFAIAAAWPDLPANRMFLTEYPRISRDEFDQTCGFEYDRRKNLPGVSAAEYSWAETAAGDRLNQIISNQAGNLGWTPVGGIADAFTRHGYCSSDSWVVRIDGSLRDQASKWGIAHPTATGHAAYAAAIAASLRAAFYPESTATALGPARLRSRQ